MRYAIFSDIHANLVAWEQVVEDIRAQAPDVLVCLGDVVGYGPKPDEVLNAIRSVTDNFVMGNHDAAAAGVLDYSLFSDHARHAIEWTADALPEEAREYLATRPLAIEDGEILFVHGEIIEPGRFHYIDGVAEAEENFAANEHFVTFVGHTHHPKVFELGKNGKVSEHPDNNGRLDPESRYIVNVGSVGDPRNPDDLRARYLIYDSESRLLDFRGVPFEVPDYQRDLASTSLEVAPFFLYAFEQRTAGGKQPLPGAEHALEEDAPVGAAVVSKRRQPARLRMGKGTPAGDGESRSHTLRTIAVAVLGAAAVISLLVWGAGLLGRNKPASEVAKADGPAKADTAPPPMVEPEPEPVPEPAPPPEPAPAPPEPAVAGASTDPKPTPKPQPAPKPVVPKPEPQPPTPPAKADPAVAWWRMEPDSVGGPLVDALKKHTLPAEVPGSEMSIVAPRELPCSNIENTAALRLGVWSEQEPSGVFALLPGRSFTLEGWVLTANSKRPIFLAGTRSGDTAEGQGWHIDIRPPTGLQRSSQMSFFYDNGPGIVQALSEDLTITDLKSHHFAAVWDHDASSDRGEMRLYLDGNPVASTMVPHSGIAKSQANPFRIGSPDNPDRIALDEVRFSHSALQPIEFLRAEPRTMNKSGKWTAAANWSGGSPPSGTGTAVIGPGVDAQLDAKPTPFAGDLVLMEKAWLRIEKESAAVIPKGPARIVLHQGSVIMAVDRAVYYGLMELRGKATVRGGISTRGHNSSRDFDEEISGPGMLRLDGVNNNTFHLNAANSFSGGLVALSSQKQGFQVSADAPGSLGTGDVAIEDHASLKLTSQGATNGNARLILKGPQSNRSASKLVLDATNTVAELHIDGAKQKSGTWGAPGSGADHEDKRISGKGLLIVKE